VGKTTTKEAIATALDGETPIFKNRANFNGLYGLPIALGELRPEHHLAVLELAPTTRARSQGCAKSPVPAWGSDHR